MTSTPSDAKRPPFSRAVAAVERGDLLAYPTETVYGLGADALDAGAVERGFAAKDRPSDDPVSVAVADLDAVAAVARLGERERTFAEAFLPGPVTLVTERTDAVPDAVTAGGDRVGIRVPDQRVTQDLLAATGPLTATSANPTGEAAPAYPGGLAASIRAAVAVVVTPGGGVVDPDELPPVGEDDADAAAGAASDRRPSTVVDVERGTIHRRGALAAAVEDWLADS